MLFLWKRYRKEPLHQVSEMKTGNKLHAAVEASTNLRWKVSLSAALDPDDVHATDIKYHLSCYVKHVQHSGKANTDSSIKTEENVSILLAEIEVYHLIQSLIDNGTVLDMS